MKKLKIKIDLEKYKIKQNSLVIVLILDICILVWIIFEIIGLTIYNLIVIAIILNAFFVILYNRYSNDKEKKIKKKNDFIKE